MGFEPWNTKPLRASLAPCQHDRPWSNDGRHHFKPYTIHTLCVYPCIFLADL